jgi:DNA-binding protein YbaB
VSTEFDQLLAEFEKFQSKIHNVDDRLASIDGMQAEIGQLEATASSPDRAVTVIAGPGGSIKDIRFTEDALKQRPQALSAAVMATLQSAVAEAARKQAVIVEEHMGTETGLVDQVLETQAESLGTTVDELRSKVAKERPEPKEPAAAPSDDFSERSVLRSEPEKGPTPEPPSSSASDGDRFLKNLFDEEDG